MHNGRLAFVKQHLARLVANAKALDYDLGMSLEALIDEVYKTIRVNKMTSNQVHIRMMITRGNKRSPSQDLRTSSVVRRLRALYTDLLDEECPPQALNA